METAQLFHMKKSTICLYREERKLTMISIQLSKEDFVYDIQGLCKSFYPAEQILIGTEKETSKEAECLFRIEIVMEDRLVMLHFHDKEKSKQYQGIVKDGERRTYKNVLKKLLYQLLTEQTGKRLPWGTLTGVRPTKLAMERLELGENKEQVTAFMKEHYFCSEEKIALAYEISRKELDILEAIDYKNGYSLYVGIPFCPTRCSYCSFPSYPIEQFGNLMEQYLQALYKELTYVATKVWNKRLSTIYIGGGTPTTLSAEQLRQLIQKIKSVFPVEEVAEFTVEAGRPDSITEEKLKVLKEEGITRISINPQSMNQKTLERIGREHTVEQVERMFHLARKIGHDNINMDLIIGLPEESPEDVKRTLERIAPLNPENLTVHSLVLKRAARLNTQYQEETNGEEDYALEGQSGAMAKETTEFAKRHGYEPYYMYRQKNATGADCDSRENIGYAKPGKECIYNILIMEEKQSILAVGAGASFKFLLPQEKKKIQRVENVKSITDYIERIDEMIERKECFWQKHKNAFSSHEPEIR